jgi:hypothetical protein
MAANGSDNPILDMGLLGMMQPNPFINPKYANQALSLPGFFTSDQTIPPTDAYGKPIPRYGDEMAGANANYQQQLAQYNAQRAAMGASSGASSPPAGTTTINSIPDLSSWGAPGGAVEELLGNYQTAQSKLSPQQLAIQNKNRAFNTDMQLFGSGGYSGPGTTFGATNSGLDKAMTAYDAGIGFPPQAAAQTAAPAGPTAPTPPNDRQAYLDALANPPPPTKVGAAVPASQPLGVPSVMTAFMQAHPGGGSKGAGGYDNSGFFNTLNQLGRTA